LDEELEKLGLFGSFFALDGRILSSEIQMFKLFWALERFISAMESLFLCSKDYPGDGKPSPSTTLKARGRWFAKRFHLSKKARDRLPEAGGVY
jgi:hypothetical protein